MPGLEYINTATGEYCYGTIAPTHYHVLTLTADCSSNYSGVVNESLKLFRGQWLSVSEFNYQQLLAFKEAVSRWMRKVMTPLRSVLPSRIVNVIKQPVWSHLRWRSITSKGRQCAS